MWHDAHDAYLESRILSAEPVELVRLMYQASTGAIREARRHLAAGDIAARAASINKACGIVIELASSLNHEQGGEISQRLARLYEYMLRRLLEANFQQSDAPLAEVLGLLATLAEGWDGIRNQETASAASSESPWTQPFASESAPARSSHGWSL